MSPDKTSSDDEALAKELVSSYEKIKEQVQQVIVGQDSVLEQLLIAMLARGHCLPKGFRIGKDSYDPFPLASH